jgi:hypothetical protein
VGGRGGGEEGEGREVKGDWGDENLHASHLPHAAVVRAELKTVLQLPGVHAHAHPDRAHLELAVERMRINGFFEKIIGV